MFPGQSNSLLCFFSIAFFWGIMRLRIYSLPEAPPCMI